MANHVRAHRSPADVLLDAERFDVYRIALEFIGLVGQLAPGRGFRELRDQLERASSSILRVRGLASHALCEHARSLLVRITQMLSKLISRHRG